MLFQKNCRPPILELEASSRLRFRKSKQKNKSNFHWKSMRVLAFQTGSHVKLE